MLLIVLFGCSSSADIAMYAVAVNGSPRKGGNTELLLMFQMSRMIIPGSTYWNLGYGLNKGEVLEDKEGLSNMRHVGKCIDWLGKAIKPDIANYPK